jgi:hypothetical protein
MNVQTPLKYSRAYLEGLVDKYLEALVAHDPSRLPLSKKVKFTENAQNIPVGEGLWLTASHKASYKLLVVDPQEGQVGLFGCLKENGFPIILSLRLKVEKDLITEIETIVVRSGDAPWPLDQLIAPNPVYLQSVPPQKRLSREELIAITDLYFIGIVHDNGDIIPFDEKCNRIENGLQTTNNLPPGMPTPAKDAPPPKGAREQINDKLFAYITSIQPRRYTVIDEERQITFGTFMFNHTGAIKSVTLPNGQVVEMIPAARRPFSVVVSELFKIENSKIRQVEAVMTAVPYGAADGWVTK